MLCVPGDGTQGTKTPGKCSLRPRFWDARNSLSGHGAEGAGTEGMRASDRRAGKKRSRGKRRARRTRRAEPGNAPAENGEDGGTTACV